MSSSRPRRSSTTKKESIIPTSEPSSSTSSLSSKSNGNSNGKTTTKKALPSGPPKSQREQDLDTIRSMWEFASFTQFCNTFRQHLEIPKFTDEELEDCLLQPEENILLGEIHIRFLKGISTGRSSVSLKTWQAVLKSELNKRDPEFASGENPLASTEYSQLSAELRMIMLLELTHWTLDSNLNFLTAISEVNPEEMRQDPLGYDKADNTYFYFGDRRLYREGAVQTISKKSQEVFLGEWEVVCDSLEEWQELAERLKPSKEKDDKFLRSQIEAVMPEVTAKFYRTRKQRVAVVQEWAPPKRSERIRVKEAEVKSKIEEAEREEKLSQLRRRAVEIPIELGPSTRGRSTLNSRLRELDAGEELKDRPRKRTKAEESENNSGEGEGDSEEEESLARKPSEVSVGEELGVPLNDLVE